LQNGLAGKGFELNEKGDTLFSEKIKLVERGENLVYIVWPGGNRKVEFVGKMHESGRYVFENSNNDFPSVIEYKFSNNKLYIILKGEQGGEKTTETFKLVRQ
jgi:hypothetical protein